MPTTNTSSAVLDAVEPKEPRSMYINDVLVQLDAEFPGTSTDEMPLDALDNASVPMDAPVKKV